MNKTVATKLKLKPEHDVLVLNSPGDFAKATKKVDLKAVTGKKYHGVVAFVKSKDVVDKQASSLIAALEENGLLWMCYPKKGAAIKTDLTRDFGWDSLKQKGFEGVAIVSIDDTWSALRFRLAEKVKSKNADEVIPEQQTFTAVLQTPEDGMDATCISIPFDVEEIYGTKAQVKVKALFDGYPYRGILANMGTGSHVIIVRKDIREAIGKKPGDKVRVQIERDTEERVVEMPAEFLVALGRHAKAKTFYESLSFTNRKEYAAWIRDAKKEETKTKRLKDAITKLLAGKKNPSER